MLEAEVEPENKAEGEKRAADGVGLPFVAVGA